MKYLESGGDSVLPRVDVLRIVCGLGLVMMVSCGKSPSENQTQKQNDGEERVWTPSLIYGSDDRKDFYQASASLQRLAASTVALMKASSLVSSSQGRFQIQSGTMQQEQGVCSSEPFAQQPVAAFCSGSLVTPDIVLTAGHCVTGASDCSDTRFVFGYAVKSSGQFPASVDASEVYKCKNVLHTISEGTGVDFAIIRLDRPVNNHEPIPVRRSGTVSRGDSLIVIGHPVGLPTKIAGGAAVRSVATSHFVANLDTYGGNSGSAVFNAATGVIEGILVRGDTDFVSQANCMVSNRCSDTGCRGEDVTRIDRVLESFPLAELPGSDSGGGGQGGGGGGEAPPSPPPTPPQSLDEVFSVSVNRSIPDNSSRGISSSIKVTSAPNGREVLVSVDIVHTYRGDLVISLVSPDGNEIVLQNRSGGSAQNISGTFGADLSSVTSLVKLSKLTVSGTWRLKVSDREAVDRGKLLSWGITFVH